MLYAKAKNSYGLCFAMAWGKLHHDALIYWKIQVCFFLDAGFLADFNTDGKANATLYTAVISSPSIVN